MWLKKLRCYHFRCFRDRIFVFHKGITGITGTNGAGKSRIVEAVSFLATGELEGTKESAIMTGEVTAFVSGEFDHGGKIITLERHLDASKVRLTYDGKELKTAKEVKELWDKLLNINPEIFNNIIIAKQGEIPKLFSGDVADRTKIFQKIFMVPNTEKLRNVIWKDYIKELPPPYPVDDIPKINEELKVKHDELLVAHSELVFYADVSLNKYQEQENLIREYSLASTNQVKQVALEIEGEAIQVQLNDVSSRRKGLQDDLLKAPFTLEQLKEQLKKFEEKKYQVETKNKLTEQLAEVKLKTDQIDIVCINQNYNNWDIQYKKAVNEVSIADFNLKLLNGKLADYAIYKGSPKCPTCGQSIPGLEDILKCIHKEVMENRAVFDKATLDLNKAVAEMRPLSSMKAEYDKLLREFNVINGQLNQYVLVIYDSEEHNLYIGACSKLENTKNQITSLTHQENLFTEKLNSNKKMIVSLKVKWIEESPGFLAVKIEETQFSAMILKGSLVKKQTIETKISVINTEISNLNRRIESSKGNQEKNDKRDKFEKMLLALYDAFHPTQFSKKVIQRYSSVVTDYLLSNLTKFNLPYTASVNDDFGIDVINDKGYKLPIVSGGQGMIIGLCLRLALLQLFAQNFSFIILDEGSTGMHKVNSEIYFDLIKNFPRDQFDQVIIIDHSERLTEVVDHVIDLDK